MFALLSFCVRKCLLVCSVTIYTFNKGLCGVVMGGWARLWYWEEMSATDTELRERREDKLIPLNCHLISSDCDWCEETSPRYFYVLHVRLCQCVFRLACVHLDHFTVSVRESGLLFLSLALSFPELAPVMDNKGSRNPPAVLLSVPFFFFFFSFFAAQLNQDERKGGEKE